MMHKQPQSQKKMISQTLSLQNSEESTYGEAAAAGPGQSVQEGSELQRQTWIRASDGST